MSFLFPFTREFSLHAGIIILYEFVLEAPSVEKPCFAQYNPIAGTIESFFLNGIHHKESSEEP
jgi:hypothetical protein